MKNKKNIRNTQDMAQRYLAFARMDAEQLFKEFNSSFEGLNEKSTLAAREAYGKNEISHGKKQSLFRRLADAFVNPFTVVLFLLAMISFVTDVLLAEPGDKSYVGVIIVLSMVTISGVLRFVQEMRSSNEAEKLKEMVKVTTLVERKGIAKELLLEEVVVGDIIHLAAGDMIPADLSIIAAKDLFISQSSLTGESEPLEKTSILQNETEESFLECSTLAFMGSNVVSGSAIGLVLAVGDQTVFGSMAVSITDTTMRETSFHKGVNSVSWLLIRFMFVMVPIVFFINGFTKGDWLEAFLFGLSVAVGLTPEMLPMIVTTNLAKGAVQLARKKTVVKNLNSIQNLGAIDILCTDKTGTLTQDKVILEYHLNIHGDTDQRVLRHAFLNSYYQTGLKNLMDVAILNHSNDLGYPELTAQYKKIDEIPFDFNRRRMSVVIQDQTGKTQLITKGAVEEMLHISSYVEYDGRIEPLTEAIRKEVLQTVELLNRDGMRVIAVAQKSNLQASNDFSISDESEMVLMGYLAFLDPPKESARVAIAALKNSGVTVKILTGDNDAVTRSICRQVGLKIKRLVLGSEIDRLTDIELATLAKESDIFAKVSPQQKARIVKVLREAGHTVGFMGDGINDAAAMKASDVGISVDTAVDIAKESADIILLEKDLMVLEVGIIEGRKTFANIIKYIKMTASSNFGNMFSVLVASAFLPFLPMLPLQILFLNLIYDISCISIPWDNVDEEYLKKPRKWDASSIGKFMLWIGPTSSVFDITTYALMFFIICPIVAGGAYGAEGVDPVLFASLFNAGWFVESLWSQTLVIHMIRTPKIPFIQSRASLSVTLVTFIAIGIGTIIPYTQFGASIGMSPLPWIYFPWLGATIVGYMILVTILKRHYTKKYGELL